MLGRALLQLCADNKLSSVHVNFCATDEAEALADLGFIERLGYQYHWLNAGFATFDDYLAQLKSKRRYAVRHERAALAGQGDRRFERSPATRFPTSVRPDVQIYLSTLEKLYWGRQYLTREFFT